MSTYWGEEGPGALTAFKPCFDIRYPKGSDLPRPGCIVCKNIGEGLDKAFPQIQFDEA